MRNFFSLHLDSIGFSASLLCAIHCSAVPLLLTISTWSGLQILNDPSIELTVLCISAVLALLSIFPSYYRYHKNRSALVVVFLGFLGSARAVPSPIHLPQTKLFQYLSDSLPHKVPII